MKTVKTLITTAALVTTIFGAITYTSCKKDKCKTVTCLNGGSCNNGNCTCQSGYEGSICDTKTNEKFAGTYSGVYCDNTVGSIVVYAQAEPLKIAVPVNGLSPNAEGTVNGNSFSIPYQTLVNSTTGDSYQFSATGTISGTSISFNYTSIDNQTGDSYNCSFNGHK
jgi:hypothetical protein